MQLNRPTYANIYFGGKAVLDLAFRQIISQEPKISEAVKHRAALGELLLRGITPTDPTDPQAVALQLLVVKEGK